MKKITKELKGENLIYNVVDEKQNKVDTLVLEYYPYKKKMETVFFKKMVECLKTLEERCGQYDKKLFRANLFLETGALIMDDYIICLNTMPNVKELVTEIRYNCYYQHINNLAYKLSVIAVNKLKDNILATKRENLPQNILTKLEKLEKEYNADDLYTDILFLSLEGSYVLGLSKAKHIEEKMKAIEEELAKTEGQ